MYIDTTYVHRYENPRAREVSWREFANKHSNNAYICAASILATLSPKGGVAKMLPAENYMFSTPLPAPSRPQSASQGPHGRTQASQQRTMLRMNRKWMAHMRKHYPDCTGELMVLLRQSHDALNPEPTNDDD